MWSLQLCIIKKNIYDWCDGGQNKQLYTNKTIKHNIYKHENTCIRQTRHDSRPGTTVLIY